MTPIQSSQVHPASRRPRRRIRKGERGFSLIELGIVIAVIAVLATVVLLGRGFIQSSRVSKAVEASRAVKNAANTYAGLNGGSFTNLTPANGNRIPELRTRNLIPPVIAPSTATTWSVTTGFVVSDVRSATTNVGENQVLVQWTVPAGGPAQDLWRTARNSDPGFITSATTIGGVQCTVTDPGANPTVVRLCFRL